MRELAFALILYYNEGLTPFGKFWSLLRKNFRVGPFWEVLEPLRKNFRVLDEELILGDVFQRVVVLLLELGHEKSQPSCENLLPL